MSCSYNPSLPRCDKNVLSVASSIQPGDAMANRISLLNVLVKDQDSAIGFYRDKLGFVVAEDLPFGPKRWVTIRLPGDEVLSIALNLAESDGDLALVGKQAGSQP